MLPAHLIKTLTGISSAVFALLLASPVSAAPPSPSSLVSAGMRKHTPEDGQVVLGMYGGVMLPAKDHSFFGTQWRPLRAVVGSIGVRLAYYPLRWIGGEVEAGGFPGRTRDGSYFNAFALRGHALFQLPYRVAPFILGGAGVLMVRTPDEVLGTDIDPAFYTGAGLKYYPLKWLALRCEWRGTFSNDLARTGSPAMHNEVLLGISFVFGPKTGP